MGARAGPYNILSSSYELPGVGAIAGPYVVFEAGSRVLVDQY